MRETFKLFQQKKKKIISVGKKVRKQKKENKCKLKKKKVFPAFPIKPSHYLLIQQ